MPEPSHKMSDIFEPRSTHCLRIYFKDGKIFTLKNFYCVDKSIYGLNGGWNGVIIKAEQLSPKETKLFTPDSAIDFYEEDVDKIFDETTSEWVLTKIE